MSLQQTVIKLIKQREHATVDDLLPIEGYTRRQVLKTMQNLAHDGQLICDGRGPRKGRKGRGSNPATYRPAPAPKVILRSTQMPSVFHLAQHMGV